MIVLKKLLKIAVIDFSYCTNNILSPYTIILGDTSVFIIYMEACIEKRIIFIRLAHKTVDSTVL